MSSFFEANRFFLRELQKSVRGFNIADRAQNYISRLQTETRSRLRDYYSRLTNTTEKKAFYEDALSTLKEFEFQFLILSIYFESNAEVLFADLRNTINQCIPINYKDEYGLLRFTTIKQISSLSIRSFLSDTFEQNIGLKDLPFGRGDNDNPEIHSLSKWLSEALKDSNSFRKILFVLLHYNRYWCLECKELNRYHTKGIILLNKITNILSDIPIDALKINFQQVTWELKNQTSCLMPTMTGCPFTDEHAFFSQGGGGAVQVHYSNRLKEFNLLLKRNSIFFEDLFSTNLSSIIEMYLNLSPKLKSHFERTVCNSFLAGRDLKTGEISLIKSLRSSAACDTQTDFKDFCNKLIAVNYLYELR